MLFVFFFIPFTAFLSTTSLPQITLCCCFPFLSCLLVCRETLHIISIYLPACVWAQVWQSESLHCNRSWSNPRWAWGEGGWGMGNEVTQHDIYYCCSCSRNPPQCVDIKLNFEAVKIRAIKVKNQKRWSVLWKFKRRIEEALTFLWKQIKQTYEIWWRLLCLTASTTGTTAQPKVQSNHLISGNWHSGTDSDPTSKTDYIYLTSSTVQIRHWLPIIYFSFPWNGTYETVLHLFNK